MNEKIRELAELAEVWNTDSVSLRVNVRVDPEKFARLILQEAMGIVRDEVAYQSDLDFADVVIKTVNEHFGVE